MKFSNILAAGALATSLVSPIVFAEGTPAPTSDTQKKEMEKIIHDYLVSHPEVLIEASQALQQKQQQELQQQAKSAIEKNAAQVFDSKLSTTGNPKGTITLVEFFDYQCIHCKKMMPVMEELVKKDGNLKIVYKEFPIFGPSSQLASKAALAAGMQGKYLEMHKALFSIDKRLDEKLVMDAAKSAGLDVNRLKKDMNSKEVTDALEANRQLGEKLHLMGTPAIIVGSTPNGKLKEGSVPAFIPGEATQEALQELIKKAAGN